jgi:hypothetical protein
MRKKKQESEEDSDLRISGVDFGNIELPDLDLSLFDVLNDEYNEETRYIKPKVYEVKPEYVLYDNAVKLAKTCGWTSAHVTTCLLVAASFLATS